MERILYIISIVCILLHFHTEAFTQNVGIGNASPAEKLDVAGNVKADTLKSNALKITPNAGTGKVLTSDASGNGNWETLTLDSEEDNGNLGYGVWGDCQTNNNITAYQPVADTAGMIDDQFGISVDINGDYAIIGSIDDDGQYANQGSASIYHHNGTEWVFVQKLTDPNAYEYDRLGTDVAISGNYAFASAWEDDEIYLNQGSVSVFHFDGNSWVFLQKLVDPDGATNDNFGNSIAVSGNFLIVGALVDDVLYNDQGSACVFQLNGGTWEYITKL